MRLTRRGWGVALAGLFLLAFGLLLDRPLPLVGGAIVGAWLLGGAVVFVRALTDTVDRLEIDQRLERDRVVTDRPLGVTLTAATGSPSALPLAVRSRPPAATATDRPDQRSLTLPSTWTHAEATYLASWPHAGTMRFDPPAVTAADPHGRFTATFATGPAPTVTVTPPRPRRIHVGVGGEPAAAGYGEHLAGRTGVGLEPAELREYVPGDAATRIDWPTTARLAAPYVREFDVQTDRRTVLIVDHRATTAVGPAGETELDYLREIALAYVASARAVDDPLGCYTVGDAGLTAQWPPTADRRQSVAIERHLGELPPTEPVAPGSTPPAGGVTDARRLANRLPADGSPFATMLRPFVTRTDSTAQRFDTAPLAGTVRTVAGEFLVPVWTVICTDDRDPAALRQTVSLAARGEGRVVVYLTPSVLFEPGGLADLEAAYDRYVAFERFRRTLARPEAVDVYEVAPGDRLEAVLAAGRRRRAPAGGD